MVSLWPWRDQTSAESFEKTLSATSIKISKAGAYNDKIRQRARKLKVGWTLYGGFLYIVASLIFILVTGWQNWGALEYTVLSGGPVILYTVRYILTIWYNYRIGNAQDTLDNLYKERDATIEKLKAATKYNSTQQLLEKYGGNVRKDAENRPDAKAETPNQPNRRVSSQPDRTMIPPPATANIQRRPTVNSPSNIQDEPVIHSPQPISPISTTGSPTLPLISNIAETAEFAPNAFDAPPPQYIPQQTTNQGPNWLDRVVNALLGEDETRPDHRLALICSSCRLVNGLAPPGTRSLEELGRWKCSSCSSWNGIDINLSNKGSPVQSSRRSSIVVSNLEQIVEDHDKTKLISSE